MGTYYIRLSLRNEYRPNEIAPNFQNSYEIIIIEVILSVLSQTNIQGNHFVVFFLYLKLFVNKKILDITFKAIGTMSLRN